MEGLSQTEQDPFSSGENEAAKTTNTTRMTIVRKMNEPHTCMGNKIKTLMNMGSSPNPMLAVKGCTTVDGKAIANSMIILTATQTSKFGKQSLTKTT